jgi:hypothetical protein
MKHARFLGGWLAILLLCNHLPVYGQEIRSAEAPAAANGSIEASQAPRLSPGAEEVAKELGVTHLIERLYRLPESERARGRPMSLEALSLRQEITETVLSASLEIDGVIAEIDSEQAQINAIRGELEARRDRAVGINTIAGIIAGGATGIVGTALQFKDSTSKLGNIIGVAGAGVSTVLSLIGLRQQRGGKHTLGVAPNLLARILDRKPEFHSDYPEQVWTYLNAVPPAQPGTETRKALLIKRWTELGRIDRLDNPKGQQKVDLLTSSVSSQRSLTIDVLVDRSAMLSDVRAQVSLMKRDLSKLLLSLATHAGEENK